MTVASGACAAAGPAAGRPAAAAPAEATAAAAAGPPPASIVVRPDGSARWLYADDPAVDPAALGDARVERASHVEPDAAGRWRADLSPVGGPRMGPFRRRRDALAAEARWLDEHWLSAPAGPRRRAGDAPAPPNALRPAAVPYIRKELPLRVLFLLLALYLLLAFAGCWDLGRATAAAVPVPSPRRSPRAADPRPDPAVDPAADRRPAPPTGGGPAGDRPGGGGRAGGRLAPGPRPAAGPGAVGRPDAGAGGPPAAERGPGA